MTVSVSGPRSQSWVERCSPQQGIRDELGDVTVAMSL
jgi:hypothetical protein